MQKKHLVVIGGGAAGFFCAINAAKNNLHLQVTLVEKTNKVLSKVKVSGGGRCNVTHACFSIAEMIKNYPRGAAFLKKAFHHFFTTDTINWFKEKGVELKTEADGRMFPTSNSSQTIIDCLVNEANKYKVNILLSAAVEQLQINEKGAAENDSPTFEISLAGNKILKAHYVCIACGGYPKISQFGWMKNCVSTIEEPVPSLFTFNLPQNNITTLMGISVNAVSIKIVGTKLVQQGSLLITHWGISGPVVLKLSAWGAVELAKWQWQFAIAINWLPNFNENTLKEKLQQIRFSLATQKIINRNPFELPNRLWEYLLLQTGIDKDLRWANLPAVSQNKLIKNLCAQEFTVKGKTTFKEEFVTAGGIPLTEIEDHTMQSKKVPGLFFAGEIINVDGVTGGFNFQNAWTTGWIAAKAISSL